MDENLWNLFQKGGAFMWPILGLSLVATALILERLLFHVIHRYRVGSSLDALRRALPDPPTLAPGNNPLLQVGKVYLDELQGGLEHVRNVTERVATRLLNRHERGIRALGLIGTISPLVGLLGTVWGMVQAFAQIADLGDQVQPSDLAGGIWTGLLTTVAGLVVAIPAISFARFFESKVDRLAHDINETVSHLDEWTRAEDSKEEEFSNTT